jgi:hypothetical protein
MKGHQVATLWEESLTRIHSYPPHHSIISLKMTNSPKQAVAPGTQSACAYQRFFKTQKLSSCTPGLLASCGWLLYVGLLSIENFSFRCVVSHFLIYSWEFLTTLDLEWNVIRGRRPHRWTIWVSSHSPFFFLFCDTSVANNLICSPGRSTPLLDWPLSHL